MLHFRFMDLESAVTPCTKYVLETLERVDPSGEDLSEKILGREIEISAAVADCALLGCAYSAILYALSYQ